MWLVVSTTNNDPVVVGNFFISCVKRHGVAPRLLRMDRGNENIYCEDLQVFFTGKNDSFLYAASTRNQRIESFWSRLKKYKLAWWIEFFSDMVNMKLYVPSRVSHQEVMLFCFLPVLQAEMNDFVRLWNTRFVRQSAAAPGGVPDVLFYTPCAIRYNSQGIKVESDDIKVALDVLGIEHHPVSKDIEIHELLICYVQLKGYSFPRDLESALDLFAKLV